MKAVVIRKHGGPEVLSVEQVQNPKPKKGYVIVKVSHCSVNHLDIWVRNGLSGKTVSFPHILGCDVCGMLTASFGNFKKGQKIIVYPALKRKHPYSPFTIIGGFGDGQGGYAEFIQVPKENVIKKPDWFSDAEASAVNVSYLTAWNMIQRSRCIKGDTMLIWGANSGVGSAALLLAKAKGIIVIAVVSDSNKFRFAKRLGADFIIDRKKSDVLHQVLKFTKNKGVKAVLDHVGAKTWPISLNALKIGGVLLACGTTSGTEATINIRSFYNKEAQIIGVYLGSKEQLISLHKFMRKNRIKPVIDCVFDLEDVKKAHGLMESSKQFGKIILKI